MKTKHKILKTLSFTSLALLMGAAGVFAFAPLGASPIVANASEIDQINTKADGKNIKYAPSPLGLDPENDPVIYTTESGLEIKFGGATAYTANGGGNETATVSYSNLGSGKPLSGYPYFTMGTYSGNAVNWVIIGKSTSISNTTATTYDTLTNWQSKTAESPTYKKFFDQTYEATTPAGVAIKNNNTLNNYTARKLSTNFPALSVTAKSEIPANCVLAISECCLGTVVFKSSNNNYQGSNLQSTLSTYYSSTLNLNATQKAFIKPQTLYTHYGTTTTSPYPGTLVTSTNQYLFALAYAYNYSNVSSLTTQNFICSNYLTTNALRISYSIGTTTARDYWTRTGSGHADDVYLIRTDGAFGVTTTTMTDVNYNDTMYIRPACIIQMS